MMRPAYGIDPARIRAHHRERSITWFRLRTLARSALLLAALVLLVLVLNLLIGWLAPPPPLPSPSPWTPIDLPLTPID